MKAAKKFSKNIDKVRPHKKSFIGITRSIRQYFFYIYNLFGLPPTEITRDCNQRALH